MKIRAVTKLFYYNLLGLGENALAACRLHARAQRRAHADAQALGSCNLPTAQESRAAAWRFRRRKVGKSNASRISFAELVYHTN